MGQQLNLVDRRAIKVTTRFVGFHRWPDAPDELAYLRERHRHEFHVCVELGVSEHDRELEFHVVKKYLNDQPIWILRHAKADTPEAAWSCERMAQHIGNNLLSEYGNRWMRVEVLEDGENGGVAEWVR